MNKKQKCTIDTPENLRDDIWKGLVRHGKVKVNGLGIFETKKIPARSGRNPSTNSLMKIPSYTKVKFRPTKPLKLLVNR